MKLKIISDGTSQGTRIVSLEGRQLRDVTKVTWSVNAGGKSKAIIEVEEVPVEVVGESKHEEPEMSILTCPICDEQMLLETSSAGRKADYLGTNKRWQCGSCKKTSYAEDWFDTSGMN